MFCYQQPVQVTRNANMYCREKLTVWVKAYVQEVLIKRAHGFFFKNRISTEDHASYSYQHGFPQWMPGKQRFPNLSETDREFLFLNMSRLPTGKYAYPPYSDGPAQCDYSRWQSILATAGRKKAFHETFCRQVNRDALSRDSYWMAMAYVDWIMQKVEFWVICQLPHRNSDEGFEWLVYNTTTDTNWTPFLENTGG